MAAKRGKSQARRNAGRDGGFPGWAWLAVGVVLTVAVVLAAPRLLRTGSGDGFFRPTPHPDAQPPIARGSDDDIAPDTPAAPADKAPDKPKTQYDFYTMLPANEVAMTDAELAASERAEAARQARTRTAVTAATSAAATTTGTPANAMPVVAPTQADGNANAEGQTASSTPTVAAHGTTGTPYLLQAGAFGASGDAEAIKAKAALLGLSARVESAAINGKTVYRVRMGPYASASALAEAKRKLADGGLPALAIRVR